MPLRLTIFYSIAFGAGVLLLLAVNAAVLILHLSERKAHPPMDAVAKWTWGLSVVSLFFTMLAPVPLVLATVALRRKPQEGSVAVSRRPAIVALVNSIWGLVGFVGLTAVMLSEILVL